jgi:chaperone BCS1
LIRPGRADVIVEFKNATQAICREMFKVFYPVTGKYPVRYARPSDVPLLHPESDEKAQPCMTKEAISSLAEVFAASIPEGEFSPAQIQGESSEYHSTKSQS